ncbi:MAG: GTPase Era [Alphaproteobacteria bacterium]|nr:MAG: GTPase Era [Alphaproteobacteria bacterium]
MSTKLTQIAIIGAPNVGKSSLLNKWLDKKISIVSSKPHTTRNAVLGSVTKNDTQIVFIDTPGFARKAGFWWKTLSASLNNAIKDVDSVLLVIDALKPFKHGTKILLDLILQMKKNIFITIHKCDAVKTLALFEIGQWIKDNGYDKEIFLTSTNTNHGIDLLLNAIASVAKEDEWFFNKDEITNVTREWLGAEYVREKAFYLLHQEIPFHLAVMPIKWNFSKQKWLLKVNIIVDSDSHKKMVIGKHGAMIKEIGSASRAELVSNWGPGHLFLEVVVDKNFRNNAPKLYE